MISSHHGRDSSEEGLSDPGRAKKNSSAIHVDVRPKFGPVEIPIQRLPSQGFMVSSSPGFNNTWTPQRSRQAVRQSKESRVITTKKVETMPPSNVQATGRSYSYDVLNSSKRYRDRNLSGNIQRISIDDAPVPHSHENSLTRQKSKKHRHHRHLEHGRNCPRARDPLNYYRKNPDFIPYGMPMSPAYGICPVCQGTSTPYYYPTDTYGRTMMAQPMAMMPSPNLPPQYSLPRRLSTRTPRGLIPFSVPTWTPATLAGYPPMFPRTGIPFTPQYHCVCCPSGNHQPTPRNPSRAFNFEGEWDPEETPDRFATMPLRKRVTETIRSSSQVEQLRPQQTSVQMATPIGLNTSMQGDVYGRKSRQTPEFTIPIQEVEEILSPVVVTTNETEKTYTSQRLTNNPQDGNWYYDSPQKQYDEVTRADGFPTDYMSLLSNSNEYTNGVDEENDELGGLQSPDKYVVIKLVEKALENSIGPSQVASTLKKDMDENFGPVWHVVAGTGAYGSNIASLSGQLLHFKAFGWAFLLWKTSDREIE